MSDRNPPRQRRRSLRTGLASILDAVGAVDAALLARRVVPLPFLPIITYHRIAGEARGDFDDGVVDASAEVFERHVKTLSRWFELIGTDQLHAYLYERKPLPPNPAMITFDDGYRECHDVALPILKRHGARATFFVASSFVSNRQMFWWDKISFLVKSARCRSFRLDYPYVREHVLDEHNRSAVIDKLLRIVKDHYALDVDRFIDELASSLGVPWTRAIEQHFAASLVMDWDQVRALRAAGMDVESHTRTHRMLHTLTPEELESELVGSREDLEGALDHRVCAIAYPVGRSITPNAQLCAAVASAGYDIGFSSATGTNVLAEGIHPLDVHRLAVQGAQSDAYFRATMAFPRFAHQRPLRPPTHSAKMALSATVVDDVTQMEALRGPWSELLARSSTNEPTMSPEWMLAWWRVFGPIGGRTLRVLLIHRGERLVGLAPLLSRRASYRPGIPFRRLELLASGEDEADETCSDYLGILADRDHEGAVADAFADAAVSGVLGTWDEIVMRAMSGTDVLPSLLAEALRRHDVNVEISRCVSSPYIRLPDTWEAYLDALSSSRRYLIRRSLRDYEAWAGEPPTLRRVRHVSELEQAQQVLRDLHSERWSELGETGAFASDRFREFHALVMPALLAAGALDLGSLVAHGEPVAAFYNIVWNGKTYFYQSGRKVDVPKKVRVGIVMHACLIRHAIESGHREYDFLPGMARYKLDFALGARPLITLRATRPSLVEAARRTVNLAYGQARSIRDNVRRGLSRAAARPADRDEKDLAE